MLEVVGDSLVRLDERESQPLRRVEGRRAVVPLHDEPGRESGERLVEVVDAEADPSERSRLAVTLGGEERQLPATRVRADEREPVGSLDDVHPGVRRQEVGESVAIGDPEGDVVERLDLHRSQRTHPLPMSNVRPSEGIPSVGPARDRDATRGSGLPRPAAARAWISYWTVKSAYIPLV